MKAKDLIRQLEKHSNADVVFEKDSELIDINFANYFRDEAFNNVEYFILDEVKIPDDDYEQWR